MGDSDNSSSVIFGVVVVVWWLFDPYFQRTRAAIAVRVQSWLQQQIPRPAAAPLPVPPVQEEDPDQQPLSDDFPDRRNWRTLYHQTTEASARKILAAQRMYRGAKDCYGGSGIYFAETPEATHRKARHTGVILSARVRLGRIKEIQASDTSMTWTKLHREGFDSIKITSLASGTEYVVYNWAQVTHICRLNDDDVA